MTTNTQYSMNRKMLYVFVVVAPFMALVSGLFMRKAQLGEVFWVSVTISVLFTLAAYILISSYEVFIAAYFRPVMFKMHMSITWRPLVLADLSAILTLVGYFYEKAYPSNIRALTGNGGWYFVAIIMLAAGWYVTAAIIGVRTLAEVDRDLKLIDEGAQQTERVFKNEAVR